MVYIMEDEELPSYLQSIKVPHWLDLIADYIPVADWPQCCLVNTRFYRQFAPRLWQDPLVTARQLGLHPNDDLAWYRRFINKHARSARTETRCYVRSMDFRNFAIHASGLYSSEASERAISESFKTIFQIFPGLNCLLVNGHPELDPISLADAATRPLHNLELLDLARCRHELSTKYFKAKLFEDLVFLDISFIPGSVKSALLASLNPSCLPKLRVLKAQGREMDTVTASQLLQTFGMQLWSLDLSYNKIGDDVIDIIVTDCISHHTFHVNAYGPEEGQLFLRNNIGSRKHGPFEFIQEYGASYELRPFNRYLADSPIYSEHFGGSAFQERQEIRPDGRAAVRRDDANSIKESLLHEAMLTQIGEYNLLRSSCRNGNDGLTHLYLNGNKFTATGIERLIKTCQGRLEHFECDSCLFDPSHPRISGNMKGLKISGLFGSAPLFRPVISSALRSLRAHHSLVTQVPSISAEGLSRTVAARLAEGQFFNNIRRAYPLAMEPNTNPRIISMTLTGIPTRSTGPIIDQIIRFLQLASAQQNAIKDAKALFSARHSSVLRGLRHIRLELEPDYTESTDVISLNDEVDFNRLLDPSEDEFGHDMPSFSGDDSSATFGITSRTFSSRSGQEKSNNLKDGTDGYRQWTIGRLKSFPYSNVDAKTEHISQYIDDPLPLNENDPVLIWIGTGTMGLRPAVNEYMWNVQDADLRQDVGPATPNHVAAGVPPFSYIYYKAWDAMVVPKDIALAARSSGSAPFRDVATAIKEYRIKMRSTKHHWDGKLELVRASR